MERNSTGFDFGSALRNIDRRALPQSAGSVIGGATGVLTGSMLDFEISDDFVQEIGRNLRPNSSALLLLVRGMKLERVLEELQGCGGHVSLVRHE
jgi:uncharacterized membrane protein